MFYPILLRVQVVCFQFINRPKEDRKNGVSVNNVAFIKRGQLLMSCIMFVAITHHLAMRTSKAFVVLTVAGSINGTLRNGLSFSLQPPVAARRGSFQRDQSPGTINRICQQAISRGTCGGTSRGRRCRSSSSSSSSSSSALSSTAGLPSPDGLPGAVKSSASSPGPRSRRGKYPVVELWRRETEHDLLALQLGDELGDDDEDDDDTTAALFTRI